MMLFPTGYLGECDSSIMVTIQNERKEPREATVLSARPASSRVFVTRAFSISAHNEIESHQRKRVQMYDPNIDKQ